MADPLKIGKGIAGALAKVNQIAAAQREANLAKFLEPSKVQQRLYHGTTATEGGKGQEAIRRIKPSKEGALGSGVYMTPKADFAGSYAGYSPSGVHQTDSGAPSSGGNMLPVHAQLKNPLIIEGTHADPMIEALMKLGMDEDKAARMVEKAYEDKGYIGKQVQSRAQAKGHDGLMQYRDGELSEVVAYNPNTVKSAIGNEGTYDIYNPDLSKAVGGGVHMVDGGKMAKGMVGALSKLNEIAKAQREAKALKVKPPSDNIANVVDAVSGMQPVLPAAEREANLTKFLAPSAEKRRMYHGSKEPNIKEFKTRKEMTDESMMTGHYADERDAVFLSPEPQFTKHFSQEGYTDTHQAPTTYPVYVQIEKPFDFDNPKHLGKVKETYLDMYHNPDSDLYDPHMLPSERSMAIHTFNKRVDNLPNDENNWARIENQDFQDVLKDLGFDSFYTRERGTKNLGVYEPNRIKSAIGNRGTYDITNPDLSKADGGKVVKGIMGALSKLNEMARSKRIAPQSLPVKETQEKALKLAQERAALPPSKGGLGLPADNTAQQRAKAMGFDKDVYHGSKQDFEKFKGDQPVFAAEDPDIAGLYGNTIYPLKLRGKELEISDLANGQHGNVGENLAKELGVYDEADRFKNSDNRERELINMLSGKGIDRLKIVDMSDMGGVQTQHAVPAGSDNIRSRFAAFDPFRKDAAIAAAMGVLAPDLMAEETDKHKAKGGVLHMAKAGKVGAAAEGITGALTKLNEIVKARRMAELAEAERALPLRIARAPAKSQAEINAAAERVGRQMLGEHVTSGKQGDTKNLAGRSIKENQRVKGLEYELTPTKNLPESQVHEPQIGDINVAFPGDYTLSDTMLKSLNGQEIGAKLEGGSRYGLGKTDMENPLFWASGENPAQLAQDKITDVFHLFEPERVTAEHLAMGPVATNFAQHFADANLRAIDYSKLSKKDMDTFDRAIAGGYDKKNQKTGAIESITFPHWPGISDPEGAYAAMKADPELRKWFNARMKTPKLTKETNMPNGLDVQYAITSPDLRNLEVNMTGHSVGEMKPGAALTDTADHNTYAKGIQGLYKGHKDVLSPFAIAYPDAAQHIASTQRPQDFTGTIQKVFPHQIVDQQYIDELGQYSERLKRMIEGKKKGGVMQKPNWHLAVEKRMKDGGHIMIDPKHIPRVRSLKHMEKGGEAKGDSASLKELYEALPDFYDQAIKPEVESYKKPRAFTDLLNRGVIANNPVSAVVDLTNFGLSGIDAAINAMRPTTLGELVTGKQDKKYLSSEKPFGGSEQIKDLMKKYNMTTDEERPIAETLLGFLSPGSLVGGTVKGAGAIKKAGTAMKDMATSKKARGGLTLMR